MTNVSFRSISINWYIHASLNNSWINIHLYPITKPRLKNRSRLIFTFVLNISYTHKPSLSLSQSFAKKLIRNSIFRIDPSSPHDKHLGEINRRNSHLATQHTFHSRENRGAYRPGNFRDDISKRRILEDQPRKEMEREERKGREEFWKGLAASNYGSRVLEKAIHLVHRGSV